MLLAIQTKVNEAQLHHRILRQLVFKDMNSRANQIHPAADDTYNWMLEDGPVNEWDQRTHAWQIFLEWLRTGDNIFFVSGNPGSGKSTLMRFLAQQERTKEELAVWAGDSALIFCVFYFWNPGSPEQRNLSGLYRSLLFQSLSQRPELLEQVFPLQLRRRRSSTADATIEEILGFDKDQIEESLNLLLDGASQNGLRLCFFIDGLDECEGNRLKHEELALKLQRWTGSGTIKLCVSSRPYSEFIEPLSIPENRMIQLHQLNECDIRAYCINRFENDSHGQKRAKLAEELAVAIVKRAQGVFLWVHLVIDMLLIGFHQADPDYVLRAQLQALPTDLDLLYTKLREPIEANTVQRDRSNRILLLAAQNPSKEGLTPLAFSWLDDHGCGEGLMSSEFPPLSEMQPYSMEETSKRLDSVTKQINWLARGFLEVKPRYKFRYMTRVTSSSHEVQFCHRTARDYLLCNEHRYSALLRSFPKFEQSNVYIRIRLAEIIFCNMFNSIPDGDIFRPFDRSFLNDVDPDLISRFELPIRDTLPHHYVSFPKRESTMPTDISNSIQRQQQERGSFTEFAAFCGLTRFVLREVAADATKLSGTSSCGNVLVAAVRKRQYELVSELLKLTKGNNQLCEVWTERGRGKSLLVPVCVVAVAEVLEHFVLIRAHILTREFNLARELLRFCIGMKISLRVTVTGNEIAEVGGPIDDPKELQVQLDAADTLKLLDKFAFKLSDDYVEGNLSFHDATVLKEIHDGRLGQVLEKGEDASNRLKEWVDEPNIFVRDGKTFKGKLMGKIEWALQSQEFVELKGWVRLY